mgnify:CR=1 FL=1
MGKKESKISKEILDGIDAELDASTIPTEMVTAALICNALDLILRDVDKRIRTVYRNHGLNVKVTDNENILTGMSRYSKAVHNALYWFERDIEPRVVDCTFNSSGVIAYDDFKCSANELCRFIFMLVDRGKIDGAMEKIFKYLMRLKAGDRFTVDDFNRFYLK